MYVKEIVYDDIKEHYSIIFKTITEPVNNNLISKWYGLYDKENEILGFYTLGTLGHCDIFLYNFCVLEKFRGKGYAKFMMSYILQNIKAGTLYLFCKKSLLKFYKAFGFKITNKYRAPFGQVSLSFIF